MGSSMLRRGAGHRMVDRRGKEGGLTVEHIQQQFEGSSIQAWEQAHNIVRIVRNGVEYVVCANWSEFQRKQEEERDRRRREYIAEQQAAAYLGGRA